MRNDTTDNIGNWITFEFKKSGLSVHDFIEQQVNAGIAFDVTEETFHSIVNNDIVSHYYTNNRWYAKY